MPAINLLPIELSSKGSVVKVSSLLKRVAIVGSVLLVLSAIGLIGFFVFVSFQVTSSTTRQEQFKTTIKSLQQTEQRLILTKDRLEKAKEVLGKETSIENVENLSELFLNVPEDVDLRDAEISATKIELSFVARSSSGLTRILATILSGDYYKTVKLTSFAFNTGIGYVVNLDLFN